MIKRIFISIFVLLFMVNNTLASGLPITDNINLQFNDVSWFKIIWDWYNMSIMSSNSIESNWNIIYRNDREGWKIYKKKISELNIMTPGDIFLNRGDINVNPMNTILTPDWQSLLLLVNNNMLYKKSISSTDTSSLWDLLINATSDWIDLNRSKIIWNYLYYTKNWGSGWIFKKDITLLDWNYWNNIMPGKRMNDAIVWEWFIVTISMMNPQSISLYDLNTNTERDLWLFSPSGWWMIDTNQSFVFWSSLFLYNMQKYYKKEITDANWVWVNDSNLFLNNVQMSRLTPNWKIVYVSQDQSTYLKNVTDANNTPWTLWIANSQFLPGIDDKNYITNSSMYYANWQWFFKKDFSDSNTSNKWTKLISKWNVWYLTNDWTTYIYDGGNQLYYIDLSNPKWFSKKDWTYKSDIKNIWAGKDNIYINVNWTIPTSTSYDFYLTNDNKEVNYINNNDFISNQVNLSQDRIMNWWWNKTYDTWKTSNDLWNNTNIWDAFSIWGIDLIVSNKQDYWGWNFEIYFAWGMSLNLDQFNINNPTKIYKQNWTNWFHINANSLNWATEIKQSTVFWNTTENVSYKIKLLTDDTTKTPIISSVTISDAVVNNVVTPPVENNTGSTSNTATWWINLSLWNGASISIPVEKQTTDFIKSIATQSSINPATLNTYDNIESFLKDNNYDYKNQIVIWWGTIPDTTMYNVVNLGLTNTSLADTLSGAINSPDYSKLILNQNTYLAGKKIINYLGMNTVDDEWNLVISVYNSDTGEYIFLKKKK